LAAGQSVCSTHSQPSVHFKPRRGYHGPLPELTALANRCSFVVSPQHGAKKKGSTPPMTDWPTIIAVGIAGLAVVIAWRVSEGGGVSKETNCTPRPRNADADKDAAAAGCGRGAHRASDNRRRGVRSS